MAILIEYLLIICYNNNMFGLFKKKVELKNDNSIMHSFYTSKGIKLGSEIAVPENFEILVMHKGKLFNTLTSGKYKMDNKTFSELINSQNKKRNQKYIKAVFHYINKSSQNLKIRFKKRYYIVEFTISNINYFANLILLHIYKVDNDYTINLLHEIFDELLLYNNGDYRKINEKSLDKFGICITSFLPENNKISIFKSNTNADDDNQSDKNTKTTIASTVLINNDNNKNSSSTVQEQIPEEKIEIQLEHRMANQESKTQFPKCPNCGNISRFNTTYCLKCGYKLD